MSSPKDYAFEIVTNSNLSLVKFVVRNKPSFFLRHLRLPLACTLMACVIPQGIKLMKSVQLPQLQQLGIFDFPRKLLQLRFNIGEAFLQNLPVLALALAVICVVLLLSLEEASDTLLVMEDMGIQISSMSKWKFLNIGRHGKFIPTSEIIDLVIHEGFHGYGQVIYYMCVLTRDKERGNAVKVIFPNFLPRKEILLQVWKQSRQMLYGNTRRHYRHVPGQGLREVQHLHEWTKYRRIKKKKKINRTLINKKNIVYNLLEGPMLCKAAFVTGRVAWRYDRLSFCLPKLPPANWRLSTRQRSRTSWSRWVWWEVNGPCCAIEQEEGSLMLCE